MKLLQLLTAALFALAMPMIAKAEDVNAVNGLWDTAGVGDPPRYLIIDIGGCADDPAKFCGEVIAAFALHRYRPRLGVNAPVAKRQIIGQVIKQRVSAPLRFQREDEGGVPVNINAFDGVHLNGDR